MRPDGVELGHGDLQTEEPELAAGDRVERVGALATGRLRGRGLGLWADLSRERLGRRVSGPGVRDVVEAGDRPGDRTAEAFLDHVPRDAELLVDPLGRDALTAVRGDTAANPLVRAVAADAHDRGDLVDRHVGSRSIGVHQRGQGPRHSADV